MFFIYNNLIMNKLMNRLFQFKNIKEVVMKKDIIIFDIDGTLVESSYKISEEHASLLNKLKKKYEIGLCGGGILSKALEQMDKKIYFDHYFSECGCVYNKNKAKNRNHLKLESIYTKNLREHVLYPQINELVKCALKFFGNVDYLLSGHFIDLRHGIIYISCVGMQATPQERTMFKELNKDDYIRNELITSLRHEAKLMNIDDKISIKIGGSVGIAIYPNEYDKIQILETIHHDEYENIIYFGDKYDSEGNDYYLIHSPEVKGHKIDSVEQTFEILEKYYVER